MSDIEFGFDDGDEFDPFDTLEGLDNESADEDLADSIAAFDKEVDEKMRTLLTRKNDRDVRRNAALWLGESGAPKAISALRKIYRGDKDERVKSAAEYALGQFKALDEAIKRGKTEAVATALQRDENAHIVKLLENITVYRKFGKRKRISTSFLVRLMMLLTFSLILLGALVALSFVTEEEGETPAEIAEAPTRVLGLSPENEVALDALSDMRIHLSQIQNDVVILQTQFDSISTGGGLACDAALIGPEAYVLPQELSTSHPNLAILANRAAGTWSKLAQALSIFDRVCAETRQPTPEETAQATSALDGVVSEISGIVIAIQSTEDSINIAPESLNNIENITPETVDQTTPEASPESTIAPTATIDPAVATAHIQAMIVIISDVRARNGAYTGLNQFWTDASTAGQTGGCNQPVPEVPDDYPPLPQDIVSAFPQMEEARIQLNTGLQLLRDQGWPLFTNACASGQLSAQSGIGLTIAQTANTAFTQANTLLLNTQVR
jgi:hypothetical protein